MGHDRGRLSTLALALSLAACSTSDRFAMMEGEDGGPSGGTGPDASFGSPGDGDGAAFGDACESTRDCAAGLFCDGEIDAAFAVEDLPNGLTTLPSLFFPGGVCAPEPATAWDPSGVRSCDPLVGQPLQGCGLDGVCVPITLDTETLVACRPLCDPGDEDACGRTGYTCDFDLHACVEGCQSDEECRLLLDDADGNGRADTLVYDDASEAICDTETFRCRHEGQGGSTGDPCVRIDDCEADGVCVGELQTLGGFTYPDGHCTKFGCDVSGRACAGDDTVCARVRPWNAGTITAAACLSRCTVGAEPEEARLGAGGHGEGCREGYRCHYNGSGAEEGVCVGGNYNEVASPNLGAPCEEHDECYSPFGMGRCLFLQVSDVEAPTGSCGIMDCAAPGLPDDLCGPEGECLGLSADITFCVRRCTEASECAPGFACADDDGDPSSPRICFPACFEDDECRKGEEVCAISATSGIGACVAN